MFRKLLLSISMISLLFLCTQWSSTLFAADNNVVTLVQLVRGKHRWIDQQTNWLEQQYQLIHQHSFSSTWLVDYDVITDQSLVQEFQSMDNQQQFGLFIEVTPSLASDLGIKYDYTSLPHKPHNAFLSGYTINDRKQIIDHLVNTFEETFQTEPTNAGAWFIDSWSLNYLREEYGINAILLVAEQYGTDHHTIRGHPWQTAYYPSTTNVLQPALETNKSSTVVVQWAVRDPILGYGFYREFSNYSVQANDYTQQGLDVSFFNALLDTYLNTNQTNLSQVTVGIEVGQEGAQYYPEYDELLTSLAQRTGIDVTSLESYAEYHREIQPSNPSIWLSQRYNQDNNTWAGWITTQSYRIGILSDESGIIVRDFRVYAPSADDSWTYEDPRHDLFRQAYPLIDQVGLKNAWDVTTSNDGIEPSVSQTNASIRISFADIELEFLPEYIRFDDVVDVPDTLQSHLVATSSGVLLNPSHPETSPVGNNFWKVMGITAVIEYSILYLLKVRSHWYAVLSLSLLAIGVIDFETWMLTPLNDLGLSYLFASTPLLLINKLLAYVITPLLLLLGALFIWKKASDVSLNLTTRLLLIWIWFFGTNLGWILPLYRQITLDPSLSTGTKINLTSTIWWFSYASVEKLSYAFSAGQIHIESFANLVKPQSLGLLIPVSVFVILNWGVLLIGWMFLVVKNVYKKKILYVFGLLIVFVIPAITVNQIDVRAPTPADFVLTLVSIFGVIGLYRLLQSHKWLSMGLTFFLLITTTIPSVALLRRNSELSYRQSTHWHDRKITKFELEKANTISDIFLPPSSVNTILFVPMGIQDYQFIDPQKLKTEYQVLDENSYGILFNSTYDK